MMLTSEPCDRALTASEVLRQSPGLHDFGQLQHNHHVNITCAKGKVGDTTTPDVHYILTWCFPWIVIIAKQQL